MNKDLKDKTLEELERVVVGLGQKKYLAGYLFKFIHAQNGRDLSGLSTLSKAFRAQLAEQGYFIAQIKAVDCLTDPDGSAKYLFELADGERIESVLLTDEDRLTLCVSTQVGCPMGCALRDGQDPVPPQSDGRRDRGPGLCGGSFAVDCQLSKQMRQTPIPHFKLQT